MKNFEIVSASPHDREWAAQLFANNEPWVTLGTTIEQTRIACNDNEYLVYVAKLNSESCGAIILHKLGLASSPYIKSIAVDKNYMGRGVGKALMEFTENIFSKTANHLFLCVSSFNVSARAFYEHLGYISVGEFKDYVIKGESEILMHKRLK